MTKKLKLGDTIYLSNPRTGYKYAAVFKIASDFAHPTEFGKMLAELYLEHYKLFYEYSIQLHRFVMNESNNISEIEQVRNISIVQGVNGMYLAKDKEIFDTEEQERLDFSNQLKNLVASKP